MADCAQPAAVPRKARQARKATSTHDPRNRIPGANLHIWAAGFLRDYVGAMDLAFAGVDDAWWQKRPRVVMTIRQLDETSPCWESPQPFSDAAGAAAIVHAMLQDWGMAGAVWYTPRLKRFRLVGIDYQRDIGEVCVGVYTPDVTPAALAEDFEYLLRDPQHGMSPMTT